MVDKKAKVDIINDMDFRILAVDMDGTLLNSKKVISKENIEAINRAYEAGKYVVISSGRGVGEMRHFFSLFPKMKYCISESGACLYDIIAKSSIHQMVIDKAAVAQIVSYARQIDVMPQIYINSEAHLSEEQVKRLADYEMGHYYNHFKNNTTIVENAFDTCEESGYYAEKICLYHRDIYARENTNQYIESLNLPITKAYSETTSVEITPPGADKGSALKLLCEHLNIPIEESIAMGDSENDFSMLDAAGLSVAVGNANEQVKAVCDIVTVSNDEHGVAKIINKYMLGDK